MTARDISYNEIKEAIKIAFSEDTDLLKFYDKSANIKSTDDIVIDVIRKVATYKEKIFWQGVFVDNKLVGYFVFSPFLLISFGLNVEYRDKKRKFFVLMQKTIGKRFCAHLFSHNVRAIKFLMKNKMKVVAENHLLTKLVYE